MGVLEPSKDAELQARYTDYIELIEGLLGPVGAVSRFIRTQLVSTLSAAEQHGATIKALVEAVEESPALGALVVNALDATRRTRLEQKARAFGRLIASGYLARDDDTQIDLAQMIVRTIDRLERPHIEAFEGLADDFKSDDGVPAGEERAQPHTSRVVASRLGAASTPAFELLYTEGLVERATDGGAGPISAYGWEVRAYLLDAAEG
jgi:hypothetical protein